MSRNSETVRTTIDAFNRRDWDTLVASIADNCEFVDARDEAYTGKKGFLDYCQGWTNAFADGRTTEERYYDAGDTVIVEFVGRGKHTSALGPIPATGMEVSIPYVEIYRFDAAGKVVSGRAYFDQLGFLQQLGVAAVPEQTISLETPTKTRT